MQFQPTETSSFTESVWQANKFKMLINSQTSMNSLEMKLKAPKFIKM